MLLLVVLLAAPRAWAWGCRGHQVVALIALAHLSPAVRAEVDDILAGDARDPSTAACPAGGLPPMAAVANWADQVRNGATAPYHYVDLPSGARPSDANAAEEYDAACADRCITAAIARYTGEMLNARTPLARAKALRYLIHFVGDIHQPLHAEAGGGGRSLHEAWDTGVLRRAYSELDAMAVARQIEAGFDRRRQLGSSDPVQWAWASHRLAAGAPSVAVIDNQLDLAGRRLARLLTTALDPR
ncbi:MAG TPA: S1/P1 nuclease [Terriglobales bacterium]|nr:S1/P1 nuclease [Terriglobales bacterium]